MDNQFRIEMREYAWKYFALHADQRIKTFNFYLVLYAVAVSGVIAAVKDFHAPRVAAIVAFLIAFLSIIFSRLDQRNRDLVEHGQEALKVVEDDSRLTDEDNVPNRLKLLCREKVETDKRKKNGWLWVLPYFTYSKCFNAVFIVLGLLGVVSGLVLWFSPELVVQVSTKYP